MEEKILKILSLMSDSLSDEQMKRLKNVLSMILNTYESGGHKNEVAKVEDDWMIDLNNYLASLQLEGKAISTITRYKYELNRLLNYVNRPISEIDNVDISNYLRLYKSARKVCNQTLKNIRAIFSSFFAWLRDRGKITQNPMHLVEKIKVENKILKPFTDEERELLFRNCKNVRDRAIMELLYSSAIRVSELSSLNISDVKFTEKDLTVVGKGNKERKVYINAKTNLYLQEYLNSRVDDNPALFVSLRNPKERFGKRGIEKMIKQIGINSGVDKAHPHRFRRTSLTNALNRGMPLQEAMVFAGHSKPETTMRYWTESQESIKYHHSKCLSA